MARTGIQLGVECGDVLECEGDVLALKYAQSHYGVDAKVADRLQRAGFLSPEQMPRPDGSRLTPSGGAIPASAVLFVGTVRLRAFAYADIREFARRTLVDLAGQAPDTKSLLVTLHGASFGLDEIESFKSEVAGFVDAVSEGEFPAALERITLIEISPGRAVRLAAALDGLLPGNEIPIAGADPAARLTGQSADALRAVGFNSSSKPFIFVAMPFVEEMDDVFYYGIQKPIKEAGFLCERADELSFTGDIMERIKDRIERAAFVVADLTHGNPNVYLEVGYAWGLRRPTILLVNQVELLKFDVRGQRCLVYKSIRDLEMLLARELGRLTPCEE